MPRKLSPHPVTPDGRYFVVRGRLWRCADPHLDPEARDRLVRDLMGARRALGRAGASALARRRARAAVHAAKLQLGERGPPWWGADGEIYDRCLAKNTPYAEWATSLPRDTGDSRA